MGHQFVLHTQNVLAQLKLYIYNYIYICSCYIYIRNKYIQLATFNEKTEHTRLSLVLQVTQVLFSLTETISELQSLNICMSQCGKAGEMLWFCFVFVNFKCNNIISVESTGCRRPDDLLHKAKVPNQQVTVWPTFINDIIYTSRASSESLLVCRCVANDWRIISSITSSFWVVLGLHDTSAMRYRCKLSSGQDPWQECHSYMCSILLFQSCYTTTYSLSGTE